MTLLLSAASFILMPWCSKLLSAIFKATETLGGAPAIVELDTTVLWNHLRTKWKFKGYMI